MKRLLIGLIAIAMMIGLPMIGQAMPGAKVLLTSRGMGSGKVIEVDPITKTIVWEYTGTGTYFGPNESIPLTNGNIIIADGNNNRLIEVNPAKQIVWQWQEPNNIYFSPVDVRKTPQGTLLAVEMDKKVLEIGYPAGNVIWDSGTISTVREAERLPGTGTPTYLITQVYVPGTSTGRVMVMQRDGTVLWEKTGLRFPVDAIRLADNSIL
ncbi:MAG: PQQ-binding-like beta-propeller repeat protein, partial [Candidatus Desantisbacteria bacterium]